ncbi:MAG: hypothetical protein ACRDWB_06230 [Acidimicrobiales bacterium]
MDTADKLSALDRLLGEDFGKPRPRPSSAPPSPTIAPKFSPSGDAAPEPTTPPAPDPVFKVSTVLGKAGPAKPTDEQSSAGGEISAETPTQTTTKPAAPFSFNTTLEQLKADEPGKNGQMSPAATSSPASEPTASAVDGQTADDGREIEAPAPDFFRSGGQSFASAAAMVNDILAATPDAVAPEPGQPEVEEPGGEDADEPNPPEVPITPDFFTAQPKKRFRLRR